MSLPSRALAASVLGAAAAAGGLAAGLADTWPARERPRRHRGETIFVALADLAQ